MASRIYQTRTARRRSETQSPTVHPSVRPSGLAPDLDARQRRAALLGHSPGQFALVQRTIRLQDQKNRPYVKKQDRASANNVYDWVLEFIGKKEANELDLGLVATLCDSDSVDLTLSGKNGKQDFKLLTQALSKLGKELSEKESFEIVKKEEPKPEEPEVPKLPGYEELEGLTRLALDLELVLNPMVASLKGVTEGKAKIQQKMLKEREGKIVPALEEIGRILKEEEVSYLDLLQVHRLLSTFEWSLLRSGAPNIKKPAELIEKLVVKAVPSDVKPKDLDGKLKILHASISDVWKISFPLFKEVLSNVKRAEHGKKSTSGTATFEQIEETFGELLLCKPLVKSIDDVAKKQTQLYAWDVSTLIVKILQKTTRKFKLNTILETVTGIDSLKAGLLWLLFDGQITFEAFTGIREHLTELVGEAVAGKSKEQLRQLKNLIAVLMPESGLVCTGYEVEVGGSAPVDMKLQWRGQPSESEGIVIEIESMPPKKAENAYEYLKERFQEKERTIGKFAKEEGYQLFLMLPVGTEIPPLEWEKIEQDEDLPIWHEDEWDLTFRSLPQAVLKKSEAEEATKRLLKFASVAKEELSSGKGGIGQRRLHTYQIFDAQVESFILKNLADEGKELYYGRIYFPEMTLKGAYLDEPDEETQHVDPVVLAQQDLAKLVDAVMGFLNYAKIS